MTRAARRKPTTKLRVLAVVRRSMAAGERFPTIRSIAAEVGATPQTVGSIVNRLIANSEIPGEYARSRRSPGSEEKPASAYRLTDEQWAEVARWEWAVKAVAWRYRKRWRDPEEMRQVCRLALARAVKNYRGGPKRDYYLAHLHGFMKNYVRDDQAVRSHRRTVRPVVVPIDDHVESLACGPRRFGVVTEEESRADAVFRVGDAIAKLSERPRMIVDLRIRGATLAETGAAVGVSQSTALILEREAHARLREILAPYA